jgi:hypothetical protein
MTFPNEAWALWFLAHVDELPTAPFDLGKGVHIADPDRFYAMLRLDIGAGPTGPRGHSGAVEDDLTALMERWAIMTEHDDSPFLPPKKCEEFRNFGS